ncbi:uncharacterized protein [Mobula birostris]|uniref:uncharacterized protein n=1 Tax=Mobula birostris TaxID=1983395 RepID=UPI003B27F638
MLLGLKNSSLGVGLFSLEHLKISSPAALWEPCPKGLQPVKKVSHHYFSKAGYFEDPDLEFHAAYNSLREWELLSGFRDWMLFGTPRVWPKSYAHLWRPEISWLWRQEDRRSVS